MPDAGSDAAGCCDCCWMHRNGWPPFAALHNRIVPSRPAESKMRRGSSAAVVDSSAEAAGAAALDAPNRSSGGASMMSQHSTSALCPRQRAASSPEKACESRSDLSQLPLSTSGPPQPALKKTDTQLRKPLCPSSRRSAVANDEPADEQDVAYELLPPPLLLGVVPPATELVSVASAARSAAAPSAVRRASALAARLRADLDVTEPPPPPGDDDAEEAIPGALPQTITVLSRLPDTSLS